MSASERTRLTSWKEIAAYLRREVRTVIRWEKERGLPVHRVPGGQGRSVFAFTDELDRWATGELSAEPAPPARRSRARGYLAAAGLVGGAILVAVGATGLPVPWPHREMTDAVVRATAIEALDADGKPLWSYRLPGRSQPQPRRHTGVIDLDGDSHVEVVATAAIAPSPSQVTEGALFALDERGRLRWQRRIETRLTFGAGSFDPPWQPDDLMTFTSRGRRYLAWSVHHLTWWPSILAVFDGAGQPAGTFVNAGWIRTSRATGDGRWIATAGFSNSRNGAAFAILDAARPDGSSPEDSGSPYECRDCPVGRPFRYFVVEWSDIATSLPPDDRDATLLVHPGGTIELRAFQRRGAEFIVELSPSFEVRRRSVSDTFWEWHQRLEQSGTIRHGREGCPYRDGPIVREWSAAAGWTAHGAGLRP